MIIADQRGGQTGGRLTTQVGLSGRVTVLQSRLNTVENITLKGKVWSSRISFTMSYINCNLEIEVRSARLS